MQGQQSWSLRCLEPLKCSTNITETRKHFYIQAVLKHCFQTQVIKVENNLGKSCFYNWIVRVPGVLENKGNYIKINNSICIEHKLYRSVSLNTHSLHSSLHLNEYCRSSSKRLLLNSGTLATSRVCNVMIMRSRILKEIIIKVLCLNLELPSYFRLTLFGMSCNF